MSQHRFRIDNLRHRVFGPLKRKVGVRNYRLICSVTMVAITAAIIAPLALSTSEEESFAADTSSREKVVDVRFLNTQTDPSLPKTYNSDESNLIKTKDGHYVLIDTAISGDAQTEIIYQALKNYQGTNSVTIDYLVISHMHSDHFGNATNIINHGKITVKNLIIKYGKSQVAQYDNIVSAAKKKNITIYTNAATRKVDGAEIQTYAHYKKMNTEGTGNAMVPVGDYLKLYFYNTTNVYDKCVKGYKLNWFLASKNNNSNGLNYITKDSKGRYLRFDNTDANYPSISYAYTNTLESFSSIGGFAEYYYAGFSGEKSGSYTTASSCNDNANSYGILAEVKTSAGNKYIYFANDLDNSGYDIKPTSTKVTYYSTSQKKDVSKTVNVYGQGRGLLYERPDLELVRKGTTVSKNAAYSESKVALEIADKLGSNKSNLVIYQESHHGIDNAPDAIATLNLNRPEVYAVANRRNTYNSGYTKYSFDFQRANYYLANTKVKTGKSSGLFTGYNKGPGVYCAIDSTGDYKCSYSEIGIGKLTYNLNGGSGSIAAQTCLYDGSCSMTVSATVPTRSGYKFLGWATTSGAKSAAYTANKKIAVSGNITLYAVWAPNRTLSYNLNGGFGSISAQICNPTTTTGSCSVKVSTTIPTRNGYKFLGWANAANATTAAYTANSTITLTANKTIYAVWQRMISINTSVEGNTGGTITPSMTNVPKGKTVTIVFSPRTDYEIDNVKVNNVDKTTEVSNNKLTLTAGDEDINIVVKYKLAPSVDPDPPLPPAIVSETYHMYFSVASGETGTPSTQSCTATGTPGDVLECSITLPDTTPTRSNYVFLGYGLTTDRNTVVYQPGGTYTVSDDVYVASVWAPIYTLSYDINGGAGEISAQTCHPTEKANDSCNIVISTDRPTRPDYEFFGWATDPEAEVPEYLPGDTFTFSTSVRNVTLYAVWVKGSIEWVQNQNYAKGSGPDLIVEIEYPMENFVSLAIDEVTVDPANYTVSSGSTIIALSSEYADALTAGGHTLSANYNNSVTAQTTFTIQEEPEDDGDGDGGDDEDEEDDDDYGYDDDQEADASDVDESGLAVPNTGESTGKNGGNSLTPYTLPALAIITAIIARRLFKRIRRQGKFSL